MLKLKIQCDNMMICSLANKNLYAGLQFLNQSLLPSLANYRIG
jgi:hypothetical protein